MDEGQQGKESRRGRASTGGRGRAAAASPPPREAAAAASKAVAGNGAARTEESVAPAAKSRTVGLVNKGTNFAVTAIMIYAAWAANSFRSILWPKYPEMDPVTHTYLTKYMNMFRPGDNLTAKLWVDKVAWPTRKPPLAEFTFRYQWDSFVAESRKVNASITQEQLERGQSVLLSVEVKHQESNQKARAKASLVKALKPPALRPKYRLLTGDLCPEVDEPKFGSKPGHIARGIPMMQVRLVFDTTAYPPPYARGPYLPPVFVDEFWMTNDQLVTLNTSGTNTWESEVHFSLMGVARWNFQRHMENGLAQNAKMFGEDSEEMLQLRDLFANTSPYLLIATLVVSVLHSIFEVLAFKNDVEFFQGCDTETLTRYVSVQSIAVGIVMQFLLLLYLWDESANFLVLGFNLVGIVIDVWKVQRAMKLAWTRRFGFLLVPSLVSKVERKKGDDFDTIAMKWLALLLTPPIVGYAMYSLLSQCHRSWYSYFLFVSSSCVYSLGFVMMTPQVFINYKHKTVAYLPWRKFIYRALNTFIDDLFAMIVRMPTMHRLSCFRDDIVFVIYLYQRHLYPVDKSRAFDEEGYEHNPQVPPGQPDSVGCTPNQVKKDE